MRFEIQFRKTAKYAEINNFAGVRRSWCEGGWAGKGWGLLRRGGEGELILFGGLQPRWCYPHTNTKEGHPGGYIHARGGPARQRDRLGEVASCRESRSGTARTAAGRSRMAADAFVRAILSLSAFFFATEKLRGPLSWRIIFFNKTKKNNKKLRDPARERRDKSTGIFFSFSPDAARTS